MAQKKVYFISDMHLGNRYQQNKPGTEKKLVQWLDKIKIDAEAIYFLGDVFDFWYELKYVVPRGHVRFLGKLAELSDLGIEIHLFLGNHDAWMGDYLPREIGVIIHKKPLTTNLLGKNFFLGHGDEVGYRPFLYRFIQTVFRSRISRILFAAIHPRWSFAFAYSWSLHSRKKGMTAEKLKNAQALNQKALEAFALSYLQTHPDIHFFMFGHLHSIANVAITPSARLLIIGDWMFHFSYAVWDGDSLKLMITPEKN